jgi:hypothetical protein
LVIILLGTGVGLVFKCRFSGVGNNNFRLKGHHYLVRFRKMGLMSVIGILTVLIVRNVTSILVGNVGLMVKYLFASVMISSVLVS